MKAPTCGICHERHWSGQPCKGAKPAEHRTIKSNAPVTSRNVTDRNAADGAFRQLLDLIESRLGALEGQVALLMAERADPTSLSQPKAKSNAERKRASRDRKKQQVTT